MPNNQFFNPRRFLLILRNELVMSYKSILTSAAGIAGIILAFNILVGMQTKGAGIPEPIYFILLFVGGFYLTSRAFTDIHDAQKGPVYYLLPASLTEKMVSKLVVTGLAYMVVLPFYFYVINLVAAGWNAAIYGFSTSLFNPFGKIVWQSGLHYLLVQSIFLFGSVYFKKHPLMKVVISGFVLSMIFSMYSSIFSRILFSEYFNGYRTLFNVDWSFADAAFDDLQNFGKALYRILQFTYYYLMAPYFYILTWFRLKETEV